MLILPLVQLRIKIEITPVPLVQLKSCGKPSLLILLTGGITGQIRRILWVDGRYNPNRVISQLAILDSRMGSLQDSERKPVSFMYADDFMASGADTEVSL